MTAIFSDVHRCAVEKLPCKNDNGREKGTYIPKVDLHFQGSSVWAADIVPFF